MSEHHYKILVTMEKRIGTFKVICTRTGETISIHKNRMEAEAAARRYQTADVRRRTKSYSGDMS
jgi:hypothetical protein